MFNFVIKEDCSLILSNNYQSWCSENSTKCYFSFVRKHFLGSSNWLVYERLLVLRAFIATKLNLVVCTLQFYGKIIGRYLGTVENCTKRLKDEIDFEKKTGSFLDYQTAEIREIILIKRLVIILLFHLFQVIQHLKIILTWKRPSALQCIEWLDLVITCIVLFKINTQ